MRFDYKLREGLATSRNALRLMELIGIPIRTERLTAELRSSSWLAFPLRSTTAEWRTQ